MPTSTLLTAAPRRRLRAALAAGLALLVLATGIGVAAPAVAAEEEGSGAPVVLIGVTGLRWDDIGSLTTPALWSLSREGSVGTSVVRSKRSFTCPSAGWLAVSAGGRSDDLTVADGTCRTLRDPLPDGAVPGWDDYVTATEASGYDSRLGLLGDTVATAGLTATGIGPGAAIALADADGTPVGTHVRTPATPGALTTEVETAMETSQLLVVDAGTVRDPGYQTRGRSGADGEPAEGEGETPDVSGTDVVIEPTRAEQVQDIDAQIAAVLDGLDRSGTEATLYVVSLADSSRRPHLQLAAATGPAIGGGEYSGGMLRSTSTRQDGFLQVTDLAPTLLTALGIRDQAPGGALVGSVVSQRADDDTATARVAYLIDQNRHAQAAKPLVGSFYLWWVALNLALYALVTVGLNNRVGQWFVRLLDRWRPNRVRGRLRITPQRVLRGLRVAAVVVAAVPVSTFLANLLPWWRAGSQSWALAGVVALFSAAIALLALLPPWRSSFLGPLGTVAGITALVLAWDVATGARLALDSMMGPGALVAGRFYGFGNPAFALFATAMVLVALALANPLVRRGRRWAAAGVVAAVGVVATVVDGMPSIGADFGGPPALVPGFAIMALLVAGIRLNWRRVLGVLLAGAVVVIGIALLDYMRPADDRTHLGRFIETVLDGGLWTVLLRKGQANLGILFGSEQTLLAIGGVLLVVLLLGRPARMAVDAPDGGPYAWLSAGAPLRRLSTDAPVLMPGLVGLGVTLFLGFALNDSGVVVPATGIGMAVPLLVAACATWMLTLQPKGTVAGLATPGA
ncbi:hypothetical protein [Cellulomonas fimi]|uniref:hypothetical protein n=1 Tax=Cellulomonas sp. RIT-PI-Y TaxID=3035297 RepID=UPI0021D97A99